MSKLSFPSKPPIAVDWDGTLVEDDLYPLQPDVFLPGAEKALRKLTRKFKVYIYTSRIAPTEHRKWHLTRDPAEVQKELDYIRGMLDKHGFKMVEIWTAGFKLPAEFYIDNKGVHFGGDWEEVLRHVDAHVSKASAVKAQAK